VASWSKEELRKIAEADDLHISPFREDGVESRWYQAAVRQKAGRIKAAGITKEVIFESVDNGTINDRIDEAYRAKYTKSPYLKPMISTRARAATIRIAPR
jgi:hypothetical protein